MLSKEKYKILVVDDQMINIMSLAQILSPEHEVIVAADGENAIEIAVKHIPDLILLDIIMPDMDGYEVLAKLRDLDGTKDIPVIFITGLTNTEYEEKGLMMGAVDYITKPFQSTIVKARVKTHLKIVSYVRTIERLCMIDTLTELSNRRGFEYKINSEWMRAVKDKLPLSILMIDVDRFKMYNDTHGHQQGDLLLQELANVFVQTLERPADFASRWGGEEFAVLMPETELNCALCIAEQIRRNTERKVINCPDGRETSVTISIGVNSISPSPDDTIGMFISTADKALYMAKNSGRNKVCTI